MLRSMSQRCHTGKAVKRLIGQKCIPVLLAAFFMPAIALSQINGSEYGHVYISGQITNESNGAPINGQAVFIESDITSDPEFVYFDTVYTNNQGFYYDTIKTYSEKGSLVFQTYDFENQQYKEQDYFRFYWDNEAFIVVDFEIYDTATNNDFQANFYALKDTLVINDLRYNFFDDSYGEDIRTWEWDFGDSTQISTNENPNHEFEKPGIYDVTLTISNKGSGNDYFYTSTITKKVKAGLREYYHVGGHAFINMFPIDKGEAYLYKFDSSNTLVPLDTARIDTLGYYYFYQLIEGKYITRVKIHPNSIHFPNYISTYHGNVLHWEEAKMVTLDETNWECDIDLIHKNDTEPGNGLIKGNITYENGEGMTFMPAQGIDIMLFDNNDECAHYIQSDDNGVFSFADVPYGTYNVHAEVTGKETIPVTITLDPQNSNVNSLALIIQNNQITFDVAEPEPALIAHITDIYPNPARDHARLSLEMKNPSGLTLTIYNYLGQIAYSGHQVLETGRHVLTIPVSSLKPGHYQLIIRTDDHSQISQKLVKTN